MKQYSIFLFSFFIMTTAHCQDSSTIRTKKQSPSFAILRLTDGHLRKGWLYQANFDEISLIEKKQVFVPFAGIIYKNTGSKGSPTRFLNEQIEILSLKKKNAGLTGALIGLGIGAATGAIIGFASGDDPVLPYDGSLGDIFSGINNAFAFTAGEKAAVGALGLGLTGTLAGFIIGTVAKKKFIIGGSKEKMQEKHQLIRHRAMIQ